MAKFKHPKEGLTLDEIQIEVNRITDVENKQGFFYFLTHYVFVEHPKGSAFMGNEIFNWQRLAASIFLSSRYIISKKRRQVGFSTLVGSYCLWRALFFESQIINVVSLKLNDSTTFLRRVRFTYEHLPIWMRQRKVEDMKTSMTFAHNNSKITSLPLTDDPARGDTLSLLVLDEFAMMKNAKNVLAAGVPSLAAGSRLPFANDILPSQLFIISTFPENPVDNEYVRILNTAREDPKSDYAVIDVDPSDIPYYQDEAWLKEQIDLLGQKRAAVEIFGEEPLDSENALLPAHVLKELKPLPPLRCDFLYPEDIDQEGYYKDLNAVPFMKPEFDTEYHYINGLWIWEDVQEGHEYGMACDVSRGANANAHAFIVVDLETMTQVAEYVNNRISLEEYKKVIEIVARYYNTAKVAIENNSMGLGVVEYFTKVLNYDNFYFHRHSKHKYEAGFPMNTSTRPASIVHMQSLVSKNEITLKSQRIINQLRGFGYTPTGKIKALGSGKDDLVLSLCQFAFILTTGFFTSAQKAIEKSAGPLGIIAGEDGEVIEGKIDKEVDPEQEQKDKAKKNILKYWEDRFDIGHMDDQKREILEQVAAAGLIMNEEDLDNFLNS